MNKKGGHGFTIVELLIVIVVIAILATFVIITFNGVTQQAYRNRAQSELSAIAKATLIFQLENDRYPADVNRGLPAEITPFINGSSENWPAAPWPDSVYDYDYFIGSDDEEVAQISIRFCPINGTLSSCRFPNEPWVVNFGVNSSAYWCITGQCRAHPNQPDNYPGHCMNCVIPE